MSGTEEPVARTVVKKVKFGVLFSDGSIRVDNVRLSYPHLAKPQEQKSEDGTITEAYSCKVLVPKDSHKEAFKLCRDAMRELLAEKNTDKKSGKVVDIAAARKFIVDGDLPPVKDENVGMWVIGAREKKQPALRGRAIDPATGKIKRLTEKDALNLFYGGCFVSILLRPWWQDNKFGKRINANLLAVQFKADGTPFGEGRIRDDDIDDSFDADEAESDNEGGFDDDAL